MPTYTFLNHETNEQFDLEMPMADREPYLEANQHITQLLVSPLHLGDPITLGRKKPESGFRDLLKEIKQKHHGSNINTW